jgi:CRP-like cAMP-binding protein
MGSKSKSRDVVFELLKRSSVLGALPDDVIDELCRAGVRKAYQKGQAVFWQGEPGESALFVLSGQLRVMSMTEDGHEVGLNFLSTGDVFGEVALLDGRERTASIVALEDSEVFELYRRDLLPVLTAHPQLLLEVVVALCEKLRIATSIIEDSSLEMAARLAKGLLRLARQHGVTNREQIRVELSLSQSELGAYVGLSRSNVNRQLAQLKAAGIASFDASKIVILDPARLARLAAAEPKDRV